MTNCVLATISKIFLGHLPHQILIPLRMHRTVSSENCTSDGQMKRKDPIVKLSCCKLWRRSGRGWSRPDLIHGLRVCLTELRLILLPVFCSTFLCIVGGGDRILVSFVGGIESAKTYEK